MKVTFPVGAVAVPGDVSDTFVVHGLVWFMMTGLEQVIVVVVARTVVAKVPAPELSA